MENRNLEMLVFVAGTKSKKVENNPWSNKLFLRLFFVKKKGPVNQCYCILILEISIILKLYSPHGQ